MLTIIDNFVHNVYVQRLIAAWMPWTRDTKKKQTKKQTNERTNKQTNKQINKQTNKQTN